MNLYPFVYICNRDAQKKQFGRAGRMRWVTPYAERFGTGIFVVGQEPEQVGRSADVDMGSSERPRRFQGR